MSKLDWDRDCALHPTFQCKLTINEELDVLRRIGSGVAKIN